MNRKIWSVNDAYEAVKKYNALSQSSWHAIQDHDYTGGMDHDAIVEFSKQHDKMCADYKKYKLCNFAAQRILKELVNNAMCDALPTVIVQFAGKPMGPKTSKKFYNALVEELRKTVPGVQYVCLGMYGYSMIVQFDYTFGRNAQMDVWFVSRSRLFTCDNKLDESAQLQRVAIKEHPVDLEEWAEAWIATELRHKKEFEEFKARIDQENAELNIGDARLPYVDRLEENM